MSGRSSFVSGSSMVSVPRRRRVAAQIFSLALIACVGCAPVTGGIARDPEPREMFDVGWTQITDRYIDPVSARNLTLDGFKQLLTVDPSVELVATESAVRLVKAGVPAAELRAPAAWDTRGWIELSPRLLDAAREASPLIRAKTLEEDYELIFRGALAPLDKVSRYTSRDRTRAIRAAREGFGGIGISIKVEDGIATIVTVHAGTPAERAGLKQDDRITHIEGEPVAGMDQADVVARLRGHTETSVALTIVRDGAAAPIQQRVMRAHIVLPSITAAFENGIVHIRLSSFNQATAANLRRDLRKLEREHGKAIRGIVLDLRGNPGGLLDQAVAVTNVFVSQGRIVSTRGRHHESYQVFDATSGAMMAGVPMIVLINGRSASASEIVAVALRDSGRAVAIGSSSYGKGTVQTIVPMPNGGEVALTWARLMAPSGFPLQDQGVVPAVCTSGDAERTAALMAGLRGGEHAAGEAVVRHVRPDGQRAVSGTDKRQACPPTDDEKPVDMELARYLLGYPAVFARALHAGQPSLAERLR